MPKLKSNRGAAKRFRPNGGGGFKRTQAYRRHILTKKATKRKRQLRSPALIAATDLRAVRTMLPYS